MAEPAANRKSQTAVPQEWRSRQCGLGGRISAPGSAKSLRKQPKGDIVTTDGPHLETKEHIGGFLILEAADMTEAMTD